MHFCIPNHLAALLILGKIRATNIPQGAVFLRCTYDFMRDSLVYIIEHDSFPVCEQGAHPPMMDLELEPID